VMEPRASVCAVSPRALVDSLALAIFRVSALFGNAPAWFIRFQNAPTNVRSLGTPAAPRQRLRSVACVALHPSSSFFCCGHDIYLPLRYNALLLHKVSRQLRILH
jgi:hypothetical protein